MTMTFDEFIGKRLNAFGSIDLDDEYQRRLAVKPLYDYFQILILEVGVRLCDLERNFLKQMPLKARYNSVKSRIILVEDPSKWNQTVYDLNTERMKVEHDDLYCSSKDILLSVAKNAHEFKDWILNTGREYYKKAQGFSYIQAFIGKILHYIGKADWLIHQYGDTPPFSTSVDYVPLGEEHPYTRLKSIKDRLQQRTLEIQSFSDLKKEDLDDFMDLVMITESVEARETLFLHRKQCPKCGGKIIETQRSVGGTQFDPEPKAIIYRVGCKDCNYEIHEDTITL